jgi:hypothetical protein
MYRWYWVRMVRYGPPTRDGLREEWRELCNERMFSKAWLLELCDVMHTLLRMLHPRLGIVVLPVVYKHAMREMGVYKHRR